MNELKKNENELIDAGYEYYEISFSNHGGLVMPLILEFEFKSGKKEIIRIPAEVWKSNHENIYKTFMFEEELINVNLDPYQETADTDRNNNYWPPRTEPTKFDLYIQKKVKAKNEMQKSKVADQSLE